MTETIGERIKRIRLSKGKSLSELAESAEVAKSYLSNVERGIQSNPSIQFIEKIAATLNITPNALLFEETEQQELDSEWAQLVLDAMASGISKNQFKEFLEFQKWKKTHE
ncbi:helix-turn-helix domain-containing protein [Paenibacillus mendelii]|uniref:Helix-turn-helix domain-containing protein n=1 Tax=Paenibacillus mendelii TaxID=206163 RepID=A0ABV6JJH8_9BACL|nr:helix-turn-helix domain-containing protein [Paenibacillus mendelii]MCQ6559002.1 helix-turn-helix domain-containing protein [Paenibacillus mendelii]